MHQTDKHPAGGLYFRVELSQTESEAVQADRLFPALGYDRFVIIGTMLC